MKPSVPVAWLAIVVVLLGAGRPADSDRALDGADDALRAHLWAEALERYDAALNASPDSTRALWGRAFALHRLRRDAEMVRALDRALGPEPSVEALWTAARLLDDREGRYFDADHSAASLPYRRRAYDRAKAEGYDQSTEAPKLLVLSLLARDDGRVAESRAARARLGRYHPHLAIISDDDPLLPAGSLGGQVLLPRPPARDSVASWPAQTFGELPSEREDRTWRAVGLFLRITLGIGLAWLAGLLAIFAAGKTLSALTIRLIDRDDPDRAVPRWQRLLRAVYRVVIQAAALYYYVSVPTLIVLAVALPGGLLFGLATAPTPSGPWVWASVPLSLAMLALVIPLVRSVWVRYVDQAPGRSLLIDEAPALWALTREVAKRVGTRPVDEIRVTTGTSICVIERGRHRDKVRDRSRRTLILGLGSLDGFPLVGFRAVLAHEYGHFLHRDTAGGDIAWRVRVSLARLAESIVRQGGATHWNVGWQFVRGYHVLFQRLTLGASRLHEVLADRVAARAYGPEACALGLTHTIRRNLEYNQELSHACRDAIDVRWRDFTPLRSRHAMDCREVAVQLNAVVESATTEDDTHPSPAKRLDLMKSLRAGPDPEGAPDGLVWDLFADAEKLRGEALRRFSAEVQARLDAHIALHDQVIAQCTARIADKPASPSAYLQRGNAYHELGDYRAAAADYTEAIARDRQSAVNYFNRGIARSFNGETAGATDDLRKAIDLSRPTFQPEARAAMADLHARGGAYEEAVAEYGRVLDLTPKSTDILLKRGNARVLTGANGPAIADFTGAIEVDPHLAEAFLGRSRAREALGEHALAIADAEEAARLDPHLPEARALLSGLRATLAESTRSGAFAAGESNLPNFLEERSA